MKDCQHSKPLEIGYGTGRASGWYGLGTTYRSRKCCEALWFHDDPECNTPEEIKLNDAKRVQNKQWEPQSDDDFVWT